MRAGGLFFGIGGLDIAVCAYFGAELAWLSEIDEAACKVISARFPGVPNLGDISSVDWSEVEPVDVLCGGFPCQPLSGAGKREVKADSRWLWPEFIRAVRGLRPGYVVIENVAELLRPWRSKDDGLWYRAPIEEVVGDLAQAGYVGSWCSIRASDIGAPHRRERVFLLASDSRRERDERRGIPGVMATAKRERETTPPQWERIRGASRHRGTTPQHTTRDSGGGVNREPAPTPPNANRIRRSLIPEPNRATERGGASRRANAHGLGGHDH